MSTYTHFATAAESTAYTLEKTTFDQFKHPSVKLLLSSANHRTNAEMCAELLGVLSGVR